VFSGRREPGSCCLSCEAALRTRFVSSFGALVGSRPLAVRQFQTQPVADEEPNPERFSERRCCAGSGGPDDALGYERLTAVAERDGMTLGEWCREVLLERVRVVDVAGRASLGIGEPGAV